MTDHDAALRLDQALDGTSVPNLNGTEPLLETAHTLQARFEQTRAIPSEEFVMQLEGTLFPSPVVPTAAKGPPHLVVPTGAIGGVEGPPAAAVSRAPNPSPNLRTLSHSRLVAIAAMLALILGGMGAILGGPLDPRSTPEPSSIPAASFGTVEASSEPVAQSWTVAPSQGAETAAGPAFIDDGLMYRILSGPGGSYAQVIDVGSGRPLWSSRLAESPDLNAAVWNGHLLMTGTGGPNYELFAFNGRSGEEAWSIPLTQRPVNLILDGNRAFVLGSGNLVSAIDLETRQQLWQTDLSSLDPDWEPYGGMNKFIYFDDGRLAITNGVLGVVTTNGQLIALDADDGSQQWVDDRSTTGQTTLSVVAEQFVVTSVAPSDGTMEHDPYNIPPSPVAGYDPRTQPCQRTFSARINQTIEPVRDNGETIDSFDPLTGESLWGLRTHAAVWIYPADRDRLLGMIRPGWDPEIGNDDDAAYCAIDGRTGEVTETDGVEFVDIVMTDLETGAPVGLGSTYDALPVWVNHLEVQAATSFPRFDPDTESFSGPRFVQQTDDLVLITEQNGTVIALPKNGPRWTPPIDSPQTSWTAEPPVGISTSDRPILISNGVGLQTFISGMQSPVQAVDLSTGTVLWSELAPVTNEVVAASDDFFLIGGGEGVLVGRTYHLVALDSRTGDERWRIELESRPVGLKVSEGRMFVLGSDNRLDAFEVETQQPLWQLDLRDLDPDRSDFGGANQFGDLTGDRLALANGVLGVVVSNGRLAAVDATDGTLVWADERTTEG